MQSFKIGFLGVGNLAGALLLGFSRNQLVDKIPMRLYNRSPLRKEILDIGVAEAANADELIEWADVIFLGVKPVDLAPLLDRTRGSFRKDHLVISLAAGIGLDQLLKMVPHSKRIFRIISNLSASYGEGISGYSFSKDAAADEPYVVDLMSRLGPIIRIDVEEDLAAFTVAASSGLGFVMEIMIYWREWLEGYGYQKVQAEKMVKQIFFGAGLWSKNSDSVSLEDLQNKVATKKGMTARGLETMRELELERALRMSFENCLSAERQLTKSLTQR